MKVLAADDHAVVRAGLRTVLGLLEEDIELLEAHDFDSALALLSQHDDLDLILLDLIMPGYSPFEGLSAVRNRAATVPLVVVSMIDDRGDVLQAIDLGALGYIPKSAEPDEFVRAIRTVIGGGVYLPPGIMSQRPARSGPKGAASRDRTEAGRLLDNLTRRQREVLALLGEGKTNSQIAKDLSLSESTVRLHVSAILDKLNLSNRTQAALLAAQHSKSPYTA